MNPIERSNENLLREYFPITRLGAETIRFASVSVSMHPSLNTTRSAMFFIYVTSR